jgi:enoyl-CoA hydratase/carnithine racemase
MPEVHDKLGEPAEASRDVSGSGLYGSHVSPRISTPVGHEIVPRMAPVINTIVDNNGRQLSEFAGEEEHAPRMRTSYDTILVNVDGSIDQIVLNRPEKRNAINFAMVHELNAVLAEARFDPSVRVVTVCGAGKVFSAGHDLANVKEVADAAAGGKPHPEVDPPAPPGVMKSWYFPKPLIAGVHGFVGPEALKTIATFDFVIAAHGTRFSYEQARVRTSAPGGNPLVFLLPMRVWKKLVLMGGWFDAEQALGFHFVQRVVDEADLRREVRVWAEHLATMPPRTSRSPSRASTASTS